ncbi:hypothetical protein [Wolbachia endosymbiont of Brugia malayi]|uniref:hypothetical protein n=1 Tax=Wolbachia endosymbiont of Brugia malayi TaxID=80849 RepID=UPI0002E94DD0|nr:hypothetical protein [Wolbachia endosymbiont of Brugia malayi]
MDVLSRAEQINNLITDWQNHKTEGVTSDIVRYLAVNPYFTIKKVVENLGVAFTIA